MNDYMDYCFETFDANGKSINLITGLGNSGTLLNDFFGSSQEAVIIHAPSKAVTEIAEAGRIWRTEMFPLDSAGNEIHGRRKESALFECKESEACDIPRQLE